MTLNLHNNLLRRTANIAYIVASAYAATQDSNEKSDTALV